MFSVFEQNSLENIFIPYLINQGYISNNKIEFLSTHFKAFPYRNFLLSYKNQIPLTQSCENDKKIYVYYIHYT